MKSNNFKDPRLIDTLRKDLKEKDLIKKLKNEFRSIREFYIDTEKNLKLKKMNRIRRFFFVLWWILKGMFFKLNPLRRVLLFIAFVLMFGSFSYYSDNEVGSVRIEFSNQLWATAIILFVLLLELKDKLLAHDELNAGRKVQLALQPDSNPGISSWDVWLFTQPANNVGGDLIDFIKLKNENYGISLADVAGKGLKAALLAAKLQTIIHITMNSDEPLEKRAKKLNQYFYQETIRSIFASLIYTELNQDGRELKFVNAGHLPPLLVKNGEVIEFEKGGIAVGLTTDADFECRSLTLDNDDILVFYSDGLVEAQNEAGAFYEIERLKKFLRELKNLNSSEIGKRILLSVENF
ncbi:MAG: PP2C family protein-serine/threonine phosphatase, partial [Ignavibacteria bacterium]